jgi:hypothetical protein
MGCGGTAPYTLNLYVSTVLPQTPTGQELQRVPGAVGNYEIFVSVGIHTLDSPCWSDRSLANIINKLSLLLRVDMQRTLKLMLLKLHVKVQIGLNLNGPVSNIRYSVISVINERVLLTQEKINRTRKILECISVTCNILPNSLIQLSKIKRHNVFCNPLIL